MKHFVLATAGHVDHGKSALVKALTGTDPDRLPEEKARGITIDLGFAHLDLKTATDESIRVGIVDVPGHEDFVRNMIAGIGAIDLALLVVAADDGWMPQTEEHLQILLYLGVSHAVIALTKSDLGDQDKVRADISAHLRDTAFAQAPIIATSARMNQGFEQLTLTIAAQFSKMDAQRDLGKPRLFIDRAFTLHGIGTVVTGTLAHGKFHLGQRVIVQPKELDARIRSLQSHGTDQEAVGPGMRTAINLPDTQIGKNGTSVARGDVVTISELGEASTVLDVLLERSPRLRPKTAAARPLREGMSIQVHLGTARIAARLFLLEGTMISAGEKAIGQLRLATPLHALLGERFILRDASERYTLAGGIILDPDGNPKKFRTEAQRSFLRTRAAAPQDVDLAVAAELERGVAVRRDALLRKSLFSGVEISEAFYRLEQNGRALARGDILADAQCWRALRDRTIAIIDEQHRHSPDRPGIDLSELRSPDISADVFDALITDLCSDGFVRAGAIIARASHRPALPENLSAAGTKLRAKLCAKPFDPPSRADLAPDLESQQALRFLITTGEAVEIASDSIVLAENFDKMKNAIVDLLAKRGATSASELRQALGTTRRTLIPLLEKLDREGITQREGDRRTLRRA
ncbi:MAG: selenocysteine-specific elongation factor [Verrucomicrobiota bacterium]